VRQNTHPTKIHLSALFLPPENRWHQNLRKKDVASET
jgi:hypothetical protein